MTIIAERASTPAPTQAPTPPPTPSTRVTVRGPSGSRFDEILTPAALDFLAELHERFAEWRSGLLRAREVRAEQIRTGRYDFDFLPETAAIRADPDWRVAPPAPGLADRRCEITGPTSRRMTIGALNSGARVWMADLEDATSPSWHNVIDGQLNLYDAIRRRIDFTGEDGREHRLAEQTATLLLRPRGWHLPEHHLLLDGEPMSGSLVDFGLYFFHNAAELMARGAGPYFYLPKMESHREARLWNEVFRFAQERLDIPYGTIRATCLVETLPAAFEMEEILYELRDHSAGLNAGRWDYIFSVIKSFADDPTRVLPDRGQVTMTAPFMHAYTELLVRTCHRRGAHAIGGMAAFVPSRTDPEATARALERTRADKGREAAAGFDGSWVAHPGLVETCTEAFAAVLGNRANQLDRQRDDVRVASDDLTDVAALHGTVTAEGVRTNVRVSLAYLAAWLDGRGAVAIDNLMEDAATVEISRMQLWQWIRHRALLDDGTPVTAAMVGDTIAIESARLAERADDVGTERMASARRLLEAACLRRDWPAFITTDAYTEHLVQG